MSVQQPELSLDPEKTFYVDRLRVEIYADRPSVGRAAASQVATNLRRTIAEQGAVRAIFAAAASQNEFLANLALDNSIDWSKVTAFHLDEYLGLPASSPLTFQTYLKERLFNRVKPGQVHYLEGATSDPASECRRYGGLLEAGGLDLGILGIGENGHLAFNDPPLADFNDPQPVRVVAIDKTSQVQQVHDGCFEQVEMVPKRAFTVTIPVLMAARTLVCIVPGPTKAKAVFDTLNGPVTPLCPASILRRHPAATLLLDRASAALLGL
jgi:glucosamine-6-phosphate deaminase